MTLHVFTSRIGSHDPDALDIARTSAGRLGLVFAPSWRILGPAIRARKGPQTPESELALWTTYAADFRGEMLDSYRVNRAEWSLVLARPRVVLECFCTPYSAGVDADGSLRCHRRLVAGYLAKLGAKDCGELDIVAERRSA